MKNENLVEVKENKVLTTSLKVAEKFGKRHDNVLNSIRELLKELGLLDFKESTKMPVSKISTTKQNLKNQAFYIKESFYINEQNKKQPMYEFDKNFFTLLVMGFTGEKALKFKIDYINTFDQLEKQLLSSTPQPQPVITHTPKELVEKFLGLCPFFKNRKIYKLKPFYKKYCDWLDCNGVGRKFFGNRSFQTALFRNGFYFIELEKDVGCFYVDIVDYNYINSEYNISLYYQHHIKTQEYRENAGLIVNDSHGLITSRETINKVIDTMVKEKTIALINEYKKPSVTKERTRKILNKTNCGILKNTINSCKIV